MAFSFSYNNIMVLFCRRDDVFSVGWCVRLRCGVCGVSRGIKGKVVNQRGGVYSNSMRDSSCVIVVLSHFLHTALFWLMFASCSSIIILYESIINVKWFILYVRCLSPSYHPVRYIILCYVYYTILSS